MISHFMMNIPNMLLHITRCAELPLTKSTRVWLNPSMCTQMDAEIVICISTIGTVWTFKIFYIRMCETVARKLTCCFKTLAACLKAVKSEIESQMHRNSYLTDVRS